MKGFGKKRHHSLADRIAASSCRICGQRGHWKWECPQKNGGQRSSGGSSQASNADINMAVKVTSGRLGDELLDAVPENTVISLNDLLNNHKQDLWVE